MRQHGAKDISMPRRGLYGCRRARYTRPTGKFNCEPPCSKALSDKSPTPAAQLLQRNGEIGCQSQPIHRCRPFQSAIIQVQMLTSTPTNLHVVVKLSKAFIAALYRDLGRHFLISAFSPLQTTTSYLSSSAYLYTPTQLPNQAMRPVIVP